MRIFPFFVVLAFAPVLPVRGSGDTVDDLIRELSLPEARGKIAALNQLVDLGPKAEKATPRLIELLADPDPNVALRSAIVLGKVGRPAIPALTARLNDKSADVRFYAISALGWIGPDAKETAPNIAKALTDSDVKIRRKAIYSLGRIKSGGPEVAGALVRTLDDDDRFVQEALMDAIPVFGADAVEPLRAFLKKRSDAALKVLHFLNLLGPDAKAAIPELTEVLNDRSSGVNRQAAEALARIGPDALKSLALALQSSDAEVGEAAVIGLFKLGEAGAPALVEGLDARHATVRREAARSLGKLKFHDKGVIQGLIKALDDPDGEVCFIAMDAVYALRQQIKQPLPAVEKLLVDGNHSTRWLAFHYLVEVGADYRPALAKALKFKDDGVRLEIATRMMNVDAAPELALPVVTEFLKNQDGEVRFQAAKTLAPRGLNKALCLPILTGALASVDVNRRREAADFLGHCGKAAVPSLAAALNDSSSLVRLASARSLGFIGPEASAAIPALTGRLNDVDSAVREAAEKALQNIQK